MKKLLFLSIAFTAIAAITTAQTNSTRNSPAQSFKAGGVSVKIPVPDTSFVEVGDANRESMGALVPENNRLLSAYVLTTDFPYLFKDGNSNTMTRYAMVEVPRQGEYVDCELSDFKQVVDGAKEAMSDVSSSWVKESEEEFNRRMKSLDLSNMQVKMGQPKQLGCFFSKTDMIGLGMMMGFEMDGKYTKMSATVMLIRVKKRLIYFYV